MGHEEEGGMIECDCNASGLFSSPSLLQNLTEEMADYCVNRMRPYSDPNTKQPISGALDYMDFTRTLFQN